MTTAEMKHLTKETYTNMQCMFGTAVQCQTVWLSERFRCPG